VGKIAAATGGGEPRGVAVNDRAFRLTHIKRGG